MLTISKPLSAGQAQTYHAKEFTAAEQNYWKQGQSIEGEWHGKLAEKYALTGAVGSNDFACLSEGQHPLTGEQLVRHRDVHKYQTEDGKTVAPVEHRAGWDATFSAPKSVSLTALVGGDDRVREAHREAVNVALNELERYTQARIGGNHAAETTGLFVAAKFEHDTARPVDGYAAPRFTPTVSYSTSRSARTAAPALSSHGDCSIPRLMRRRFISRTLPTSFAIWAMRSRPEGAAPPKSKDSRESILKPPVRADSRSRMRWPGAGTVAPKLSRSRRTIHAITSKSCRLPR